MLVKLAISPDKNIKYSWHGAMVVVVKVVVIAVLVVAVAVVVMVIMVVVATVVVGVVVVGVAIPLLLDASARCQSVRQKLQQL